MRRILWLALVALAVTAAPAGATPVKCADGDSTPDGRVFPEGDQSTNFLRIDEFECGTALLEARYPELLERRVLGEPQLNHRPEVAGGLLGDESALLLRDFFGSRR